MNQRQEKILQQLAEHHTLSVTQLSNLLNVSEVTIRSDLNGLARAGLIKRIHGGAQILEERVRQEYTFQTRKNQNADKKARIARQAAALVEPVDTIVLDASSTAVAVARALHNRGDLREVTAIPTGIWTALELMGAPNINVLLIGGYLRQISGSIYGLPAEEMLGRLNIRKAFLGAWGLSVAEGATDNHLLEVDLKRTIVHHAQEVIIVADGSKFSHAGLATYARPEQISKIITDSSAPKKRVKEFEALGIEVIVAQN